MHEFSAADEFVQALLQSIPRQAAGRLRGVRLRLGPYMHEDPLRQALAMGLEGSPWAGLEISIERASKPVFCECNYLFSFSDINHPHGGEPVLCPECDRLVYVNGGPDIELLELLFKPSASEEGLA
jgi:Zn finger protein HypA/HybF involved in hydrogenase expression